jgi:hypothetical protein
MLTSGTGEIGGCGRAATLSAGGGGDCAAVVAETSGKFMEGAGVETLAPGTATKLDCIPRLPDTALRARLKFVVGFAFMADLRLL